MTTFQIIKISILVFWLMLIAFVGYANYKEKKERGKGK